MPKLLDLFCGIGGAAVGYHRAGWDIVGVDINPQPDYPFEFWHVEALELLRFARGALAEKFQAIHASPPCQSSSALTKGTNKGREYPDLIPQTRAGLEAIGLPYVIENVQGASVRRDITLCGEMFGLDVIRHRYFELGNWTMDQPPHIKHRGRVAGMRHGVWYEGPYFAVYGDGGGKGTVPEWQNAMGIDWSDSRKGIAEAIPPAYTELIGRELLKYVH